MAVHQRLPESGAGPGGRPGGLFGILVRAHPGVLYIFPVRAVGLLRFRGQRGYLFLSSFGSERLW